MGTEYFKLLSVNKSIVSPLSQLLRRRKLLRLKIFHLQLMISAYYSGEWGSGAGKGGGSGGAVREAGGIFGKMEAAREEEYFRKLQKKQISKLKEHINEEISHHKRLIQQHKEAISRLENRVNQLKASETQKD